MAINSYKFDRYEFSPAERRLTRDSTDIKLEPRTIALLTHLIANRHRIVPAEELLRKVWAGRSVCLASVSVCVSDARRALEDTTSRQRLIRTVYGAGYQFVAQVTPVTEEQAVDGKTRAARTFGRQAELLRAREWLTNPNEVATLVMVSGEPGIGKTHLLREICRLPGQRESLLIPCDIFSNNPPLYVWSQVLKSDLDLERRTNIERSQREHPSDAEFFSPENARFHFFAELKARIVSRVRERPLLIAIDDLHRADDLSLRFLKYLVTALDAQDIRFVASFRTAEIYDQPALRGLLGGAYRKKPDPEIRLSGLPRDDIRDLVFDRALHRISDSDLSFIWRKTRGNPLFSLLLASAFGHGGRELVTEGLPPGVASAATAHLSALDSTAFEAIGVASVIGNHFDLDVLARCLDLDEAKTLDVLGPSLAKSVISQPTSNIGSFEFQHAIVKDALYEQLDPRQRRKLHLEIANFLIASQPDIRAEASPQEIAFHLGRAGDSRAHHYNVQSAKAAEKTFSYEQAATHYQSALAAVRASNELSCEPRLDLLLSLGRCELLSGRSRDASQTFRRAAETARSLPQPERLAEVALRSAPDFFSIECGVYDEDLIELLEEAYELVPVGSKLEIRVAARLILALLWANDTEGRIAELVQVVREGLDRHTDETLMAEVLPALWRANWDERCLSERLRIANLLPHISHKLHKETILVCKMLTVAAHLELGDRTKLDKEIMEFENLARRTKHPRAIWYAEMFRAVKWLMHGDFGEAEKRYREFSRLAHEVNDSNGFHSAALHEFLLLWEAGRSSDVIEKTEKAIARYPNVPGWRAILAFLFAEAGEKERAAREYDAVKQLGIDHISKRIDWISAFTLGLAQTCYALGDSHFASELYRKLSPYSGREAIAGAGAMACGSVDRYLGMLAETAGGPETALWHYRKAMDFDIKFGAQPWAIHAQLNAATVLASIGRTNESLQMSRLAITGAKEMGMQNVAFKGERLLRRIAKQRLSE